MAAYDRAIQDYYSTSDLTGSGYYEGTLFQKGSGLGSIIKSIGKIAMPLIKKAGRALLPIARRSARHIAREGVSALGEVAGDILEGKNVKNSLQHRSNVALENLRFDAARGIKRKFKKM